MNKNHSLESLMDSIQKSELTFILGNNLTGKTTFAIQLAIKMGLEQQKNVLFMNSCISKDRILSKMLSPLTNIKLSKLTDGELNKEEHKKLFDNAGKLSKANIFMDDTIGLDVKDIIDRVCILRKTYGKVDLLIIDGIACIRQFNIESLNALRQQICKNGTSVLLIDVHSYDFINPDLKLIFRRQNELLTISFNDKVLQLRFIEEYGNLV